MKFKRHHKDVLLKECHKPIPHQDWNSEPHQIVKDIEQKRIDYNQLHVALGDSRQLSVAYPILARYGLMERTQNGFKAIDPDAVVRRCRELIDRLADEVNAHP